MSDPATPLLNPALPAIRPRGEHDTQLVVRANVLPYRRHVEKAKHVPGLLKRQIIDAFQKAGIKGMGIAYECWCEEAAPQFQLDVDTIKKILADEGEAWFLQLNHHRYTEAQQLAKGFGAGVAEVIQVLHEGMRATKSEIVMDHGSPLFDEEGGIVTHEQPDWKTRVQAAKELVDIHGMRAPEQLIIDATHKHTVSNMTEEELDAKLEHILRAVIPDEPGGKTRALGSGKRANGAPRPRRQVVLADPVHADQG